MKLILVFLLLYVALPPSTSFKSSGHSSESDESSLFTAIRDESSLSSAVGDKSSLFSSASDESSLSPSLSDESSLSPSVSDESSLSPAVRDESSLSPSVRDELSLSSAVSNESSLFSSVSDESSLFSSVSDESSLSSSVSDESSLSFEWTGPRSLRVTNKDGDEDDIRLRPAPGLGGVQADCLFNGYLMKEPGSSVGVVGCQSSEESQIVIVSNYSTGTMFTLINENKRTLELLDSSVDVDHRQEELDRVKRGTFYEDDEYVYEYDYNTFDGADPIPPNLYYSFYLGFDESILKKFNGNKTATKEYIASVATLAQTYFKSDSLGTRIHFDVKDNMKYLQGKEFKINPKEPGIKSSFADSQTIETSEPLIIFTKTDDSESFRGVARIRGACNATLGRVILKHREQVQRAALTMAHEMGHLFGKLHDSQEDKRNARKPLPEITNCKGQGIMTDQENKPAAWSVCSSDRLFKWYTNHGNECLQTAPTCDNTASSGPCSCGLGANTNLCKSQDEGYCLPSTATCMVKETKLNTCQSYTSTPGDILESGCEQPQELENGLFVCLDQGLTCHILCEPGYELETSSPRRYIQCIDRSWTQMPSTFRCIPHSDDGRKSHPNDKEVLWTGPWSHSPSLNLSDFTPVASACAIPNPDERIGYHHFQEINGKLYICNHELCQSYNAEDKTWQTIPGLKFKSKRKESADIVIGNKWIVLGGKTTVNGTDIDIEYTEVWTAGTDNWVVDSAYQSPLPTLYACLVNLKGKLMQIGGYSIAEGWTTRTFLGEKEVGRLKRTRHYPTCTVYDGKVWIAGGGHGGKIEVYDPQTESWSEGPQLPMPDKDIKDYRSLLIEIRGNLHYIGGYRIPKVYKLDKDKNEWEKIKDIENGRREGHPIKKYC